MKACQQTEVLRIWYMEDKGDTESVDGNLFPVITRAAQSFVECVTHFRVREADRGFQTQVRRLREASG